MSMINIFVYGTLMAGERAHYMLGEVAHFMGKYRLANYAMYNLGSYPGIVEKRGESVVGEVHEVPEELLSTMDRYEGEGSLYSRKRVNVYRDGKELQVYAYIYNRDCTEATRMREPWNKKDSDYVWYAAYGSNMNAERFLNYIEGGVYPLTGKYCSGCHDKSHWVDEAIRAYKGEMYFGNISSTWEGKGVAFYDSSRDGLVKMRLYKITREQLHDIQGLECDKPYWYGKLECLDVLSDNCPVYTVTSEEHRDYVAPCDKYYRLVMEAVEGLGNAEDIDNQTIQK